MHRQCKHDVARCLTWLGAEWVDSDAPACGPFDAIVCSKCGAWLGLGPSNDTPIAVCIEIRAAALAATVGLYPRECETHGWEAHASNMVTHPVTCDPVEDFHAGWLCYAIQYHDELAAFDVSAMDGLVAP